ncbi:MAG: hypothetical protein IJQ83_00595 [Bacteroidales bacterium]|nr:hypothetical protein [Bacteroidales bacterium]
MKTKFLIILALSFVTASCTKPTQSYYVQDSNRVWFADTANLKFTMRDDNGVSQSFSFADIDQYMSEQESYFMGIYVKEVEFEHVYQSGFSSFSTLNMSVSLTADHLEDELEGTDDFRMDFGPAHYTMRIEGNKFYPRYCYEYSNDSEMEFVAEYLDKYDVHDVEYQGVMHLKLIDAAYPQTKNFPTEVYYAKHYGLIQCTLDDKLTLYRLLD